MDITKFIRYWQATKLEVAPAPTMEWIRKPLGTIRVSMGYMSTFEDAEALVNFIRSKYVDRPVEDMAWEVEQIERPPLDATIEAVGL
jgi:hypothetical protein